MSFFFSHFKAKFGVRPQAARKPSLAARAPEGSAGHGGGWDNATNGLYCRDVTNWGLKPTVVASGREALAVMHGCVDNRTDLSRWCCSM